MKLTRVLKTETQGLLSNHPPFLMDEHQLSTADSKRIEDAYYLWSLVVWDSWIQAKELYPELERNGWSRNCSLRALVSQLKQLVELDVGYVMTQQKAQLQALRHLCDDARRHYSVRPDGTYCKPIAALKKYAQSYCVETKGATWNIVAPVFIVLWVSDDPKIFKILNTMVQFMCRVTLTDVDWIEQENIDAYVQFEEELKAQKYDPVLLEELSCIIEDWFKDFEWSGTADHGYGATAGVKRSEGTARKFQDMEPTYETYYVGTRLLNWLPGEHAWTGLARNGEITFQNYLDGVPSRSSRDLYTVLNLVPKGVNKKRPVCMEPTVHQFFEKQIGERFDTHFRKHPEIHVDLHDQGHNRKLTVIGSKYRNYGTIDLSSASDSVTKTIVKALFYKVPALSSALLNVRTGKVQLPNGEFVVLEKFAPMGSATCFPVECVVFSAICALANKRLGLHSYYRVYGDDMVVHISIFSLVIELLQQMHFIVNIDKSFEPQLPFKESCGIEVYKGVDVTPLRLSRKWDVISQEKTRKQLNRFWRRDHFEYLPIDVNRLQAKGKRVDNFREVLHSIPDDLSGMYDVANEAYERGLTTLRKDLIARALSIYKAPTFSKHKNIGFLTEGDIMPLKWRWNHNYQRLEVYTARFSSRIASGTQLASYSKLIEEYSYTRRETLIYPDDRLIARSGKATSYLEYVWRPYCELSDDEMSLLQMVGLSLPREELN